jgi:hypothetical protein
MCHEKELGWKAAGLLCAVNDRTNNVFCS